METHLQARRNGRGTQIGQCHPASLGSAGVAACSGEARAENIHRALVARKRSDMRRATRRGKRKGVDRATRQVLEKSMAKRQTRVRNAAQSCNREEACGSHNGMGF
ncbi:hypothetical protein TRVL_05321 [Trypanosoma vivax]|nr:hypothetical protein TRVL_05321 [Trypanosoma vivax]